MKLLITGFAPFNGQTVNPSELLLQHLTAPAGTTLIKAVLPVEFQNAACRLQELLQQHQPDILLSVGQAGGRPEITVERVAINIDCVKSANGSKQLPDNAGDTPVDTPIVAGGPAAYFATLPLWKLVDAIQAKDIPAALSNTAGTYVCNHIMYTGLHQAATLCPQLKAGFIHVPFLPEQIADRADRDQLAAMPLEDMITALQAVLDTLATT